MSSQTMLATIQITPTQQLRVTGSIQDRDHREAIGVDIRKWYLKGGEYYPTPKGIWLNLDQLKKLLCYMLSTSENVKELLPDTAVSSFLNQELLTFLAAPEEDQGFHRLA